MGDDAGKVRAYSADVADRVLVAPVAGILKRDGETFLLDNISAETARGAGKPALISQARTFAAQALEKKKIVNCRFTFKAETESAWCGLAQPLVTAQSEFALLVLRRTPFTPVEISAFHVLGSLARMAIDNAELASLSAGQQQHLDQLLRNSSEIGTPFQLRKFLSKYVGRATAVPGFQPAFIAVAEGGACRARWGSVHRAFTQPD